MSLACHPDKCKHEKATGAQTAVNKAWEVLRVSASRTAYDSSFRAMIQRENEARQREEIRKQKQTQPAITPKMFQQQSVKIIQRLARKQMQRAVRKVNKMLRLRIRIQPSQAARKRLIPEKGGPQTTWDVGTSTLKELKTAISVKVSDSVTRKFSFKEWQDRTVAKQVAEKFAKSTLSITNQFDCVKLKKDKAVFAQQQGVECTGKETVAVLRGLLEEA